jgi:hypothetical protein
VEPPPAAGVSGSWITRFSASRKAAKFATVVTMRARTMYLGSTRDSTWLFDAEAPPKADRMMLGIDLLVAASDIEPA